LTIIAIIDPDPITSIAGKPEIKRRIIIKRIIN